MKRRKTTAGTTKSETTQAPLQPAYFEPEPAQAGPQDHDQEPEPQPASEQPSDTEQPETGSDSPVRKRRRRSRGGRGRGKRGGQPASTPMPGSAAESSEATEATPAAVSEVSAPPAPVQPAQAQQIPPAPARAPKGVVVLSIGLPGSGKSSWFKRHNINPLSSDLLRQLLFDDPTEQRFQDLVFSNLRSMLKARLIARRPMNYVDATNLSPHERHGWVKLAKDFGYEVQAVFFDVPLEVCLERNAKRHRVVSDEVMRRMSSKLRPPTFEEGFSKITVVRVKPKES